MKVILLNISVIIPTFNRSAVLNNTLASIGKQNFQPFEIIIVDGSDDFVSINETNFPRLKSKIIHRQASELGAAKQRNQGINLASYDTIAFFDDDILLEDGCLEYLWEGLKQSPNAGGINAVITNQHYHPLGKTSKLFYKVLGVNTDKSLAGRCIGPAINFLPEMEPKSEYVEVDWLNTTCTLYRKEALPTPVFDEHFVGYSLMEDLALSLRVGKKWTLLNCSKARIYHDSQPSEGKSNIFINAEMDLVNRFYIMKYILNKTSLKDCYNLFLQQLFAGIASKKLLSLAYLKGKFLAVKKIRSI